MFRRKATAEIPDACRYPSAGRSSVRLWLWPAIALVLYALPCWPASAFTEIGVRGNKDGAGPSHIFHLHDQVVAIVDPLEGTVEAYQVGVKNHIAVAALPNGSRPWRLVKQADKVQIISEDEKTRIEVPRDEKKWPQAFSAIALDRKDPSFQAPRAQRTRSGLMLLAAGGAPALNVHPLGPYYMASLRELERIGDGQRYVLWKEYHLSDPQSGNRDDQKILVDVYIGRFKGSAITGLINLNLAAMSRLGFDYATILPNGTVALLATLDDGPFVIYGGEFDTPPPLVASLQRTTGHQRKWALPVPPTAFQPMLAPADTKRVTVSVDTAQPLSKAEVGKLDKPPVRKEFVAIMNAYRDKAWTLTEKNLRNPCESQIVPDIAMSCLHPTRFVWPPREAKKPYPNPMIGLPYDWGGADAIEEFDDKLARGFAAGNIGDTFWADDDTQVKRVTTGVDCSGLVSQVWKLGDHVGTDKLNDFTSPVAEVNHMIEGDAFLHTGHHAHVMLYREQLTPDGASLSIRVTEASSRCGAVCDSIYEIDHFNGFTLRRRKGL